MKIKEELSNEFKKEEGVSIKILKESDKYILKEINYDLKEEYIPYSVYYLYGKTKNEKCIIILGTPNPNKDSIARDLFLKYQNGCKEFMINYFDLIEKKISGFVGYHTKDKNYKLFSQKIKQDGVEQVVIGNKKNDKITDIIGIISLTTLDESEKLAIKIIDYFENFRFMVME